MHPAAPLGTNRYACHARQRMSGTTSNRPVSLGTTCSCTWLPAPTIPLPRIVHGSSPSTPSCQTALHK